MCLNAGPLTPAILPREGRLMTEEDIAVLWLWVPAAVMSRRSSLDKISGVHFKGKLVYNTPSEVALLSTFPQLMDLQWAVSEPKHLNWPIQSNKIETVILIIPTPHTHTKKIPGPSKYKQLHKMERDEDLPNLSSEATTPMLRQNN